MTLRNMMTAISASGLMLTPLPAHAQLGNILGGALPDIGSVGVGNAAGLLGYCVKNKLMRGVAGATGTGGTSPTQQDNAPSASSVLDILTKKKGVKTSPGYLAGSKGVLQADGGTVPIGGLGGQIKGKVCDLVLDRAKGFL